MRHHTFVAPLALTTLILAAAPARAAITVSVDAAAGAHPISPLIYGVNYPDDAQIDAGRITVARWGGNTTTRYNYEIDVANTASDYYFENTPGCFSAAGNWCANPPSDPKESSTANAFLAKAKSRGIVALFTIPTLGWIAKAPAQYTHPFACGCPKSVAGSQGAFDASDRNCGNGQSPGGGFVACAGPDATSVPTSPGQAKAWVAYLVSRFGPSNGQRVYALDNEPALWSSTHRDVHPEKLGYDELWQKMRDYAVAILEADPTAEISGPAEWGFPNYFCSDADDIQKGCSATSPDRAAHGGVELTAWLLDQAKDYEQKNGKRILHYLDLHYYPQGGSGPAITRSLWDASYTDPSWINDTVRLVPRMREWTAQHYPGTKTAVSEYDFHAHEKPVGAVLYAEVLGIFGREGLDMATAWAPPATSEPAFAAYALYRNFDGQGGQFEATSVHAAVSGGGGVEAYAAAGASRVTVALVNENGADTDVTVTLGNFVPAGAASLFTNGGTAAIVKKPDVPVESGSVTVTLPATSIAMLVVDGVNPSPPAVGGGTSGSSAASGPGSTNASGAAAGGSSTNATSSGAAGGAGIGGGSDAAAGSANGTPGCACSAAQDAGSSSLVPILGAMIAACLASVRRRRR